MDKVFINFKDCNGINKFMQTFNFETKRSALIYASNGTMKTSFAKTFICLSLKNREPINYFTNKTPKHTVKFYYDNKEYFELKTPKDFEENVFVIQSFDEDYNFDNISALMVDSKMRKSFEEIIEEINSKKYNLINLIKKTSKLSVPSKQNKIEVIEKKFFEVFSVDEDETFLELLIKLKSDLEENNNLDVSELEYNTLFSKKVIEVLNDKEVIESIDNYIKNLDKLLDKSKIFNKDYFDNNNAENLYKSIKTNNLFKAGHSIKFKGKGKKIDDLDDFKNLLDNEISIIMKDEKVRTNFNEINDKLTGNKDLIVLKKYLLKNPLFAIKLQSENRMELEKEFWLSILNYHYESYEDLINSYKKQKTSLDKIKKAVEDEKTDWEKIVDLFNRRFRIPFELKIENKKDVILNGRLPNIVFSPKNGMYKDESVDFKTLKKFYSAGQKRAFYLLNILYEIELRKNKETTTLLIADDIADSFDYENKYAIIEYLYDLSKDSNFRTIILTHNYDFFRTVKSRLNLGENSYVALKREHEIKLDNSNLEEKNNILKKLKIKIQQEDNKEKAFLALIPFLRNLSDLAGNNIDKNILTNLLHYKKAGKNLKIVDLIPIYKKWNIPSIHYEKTIYELIYAEADYICSHPNNSELLIENKIVLSMAIRLYAEKYMLNKLNINDEDICRDQTRELFEKFKKKFNTTHYHEDLEILESVNIMTPENIHVNSFMYEPILDMDDDYLRNLLLISKQKFAD